MNIKNIIATKPLIVLFFLSFFFNSCKDEDRRPEPDFEEEYVEEATEPEGADIQQTLNGITELSHFAMVMGAYDFPEIVADEQMFTVFAPVNDAFPPYDTTDENTNLDASDDELVSYYITQNAYSVEELRQIAVTDTSSYINSLSGEKIYVVMDGETLTLEGNSGQKAKIIQTYDASNGVIHVVDNALLPTPASNP